MGKPTPSILDTVSYNASNNYVILHHWEQNSQSSKPVTENTQNDCENITTQHLRDTEINKENHTAITDTIPRDVTPLSSSPYQHHENGGVESQENCLTMNREPGSDSKIQPTEHLDSYVRISKESAQCLDMITFKATNPERNPEENLSPMVDAMEQAKVAMSNGDYPQSSELQFNNTNTSVPSKSYQPEKETESLQSESVQPTEGKVSSKVVCDTQPSLNHPVADKDGQILVEQMIPPRVSPTFPRVPCVVGKPRWPISSSLSLPQPPISSERIIDSQSQSVQVRNDIDDSREAYGDIENSSLMSNSYPSDGIKYRNGSLSRKHMNKVGDAIDERFLLACDSDRSDGNDGSNANKASQELDHYSVGTNPDPSDIDIKTDDEDIPNPESYIKSNLDTYLDQEDVRGEVGMTKNNAKPPKTKTRDVPNKSASNAIGGVQHKENHTSSNLKEPFEGESNSKDTKARDWLTKGARPKMKIEAWRKSHSADHNIGPKDQDKFEMTLSYIKAETTKSSQEPKKIKECNRENDQEATSDPNSVSRSDPTAPKIPISNRPDYINYHMNDVTWYRDKLEGPLKRFGTFQLAPYESRYYHITPCPIKHRKHRQHMRKRTECNCDGCWWETTLFILNHDCPIFEDHISDSWIPPDSKLRPRYSESIPQPAKGIVVVASNNRFKGRDDIRCGSNEDCRKIRDCFGLLGYLVHEWEDCSSTFLVDIMVLYNKSRIMDDLESFHFFVLSHGTVGKIQGVDGELIGVEKIIGAMESRGCAMSKMQSFLYICTCQGGRVIPKPPWKRSCSLKERRNRRRNVDRFAPGGTNEDTPATGLTETSEYDVESFLSQDGPGDEKECPQNPTRPSQMSFTWMRKQPRPKRNLIVFYAASENQISFRHSRHGTLVVSSICRNVFYYSDMGPGINLSIVRCLQKVREEVRELSKHTSDQDPVVIYNNRLPKINE